MKDYYATLSVSRGATPQQIRDRFLELARKGHPDLYDGAEKIRAEEEFQGVTEAFNVLSKPERRRQHDLELSTPQTNQAADPKQMVRVFRDRGEKAMAEGKSRDAALNFERSTQLEPDNPAAWYNLAQACSHHEGLLSKALSAIAKACELDKMNGEYHKTAGRLFEQGGMSIRAERYYRQAQRWLGNDPEVQKAMSRIRKQK